MNYTEQRRGQSPILGERVCMDKLSRLRENIASVYRGSPQTIDRLIVAMLASGHVLLEDVPGVGKTLLAQALARSMAGEFRRIQMTPDLLPADVLGVNIWEAASGRFRFQPGPVFCNVLLADEINRTTPRTQSALLEAMCEQQVSLDGQTHALPPPFLVLATQNPMEFEGTFPLPESQMDRFFMRLHLGYPEPEAEADVLLDRPEKTALRSLQPVLSVQEVIELQNKVNSVRLDRSLAQYIVALANATRSNPAFLTGLSPRGSLALSQAARASAVLENRDYVVPDDVVRCLDPVCSHRLITRDHDPSGNLVRNLLTETQEQVALPV